MRITINARMVRRIFLTLLFLITLLAFSASISAAGSASITVNPIEGNAGDIVTVEVRMAGITEIPGVEGIAGGEFKLLYDPLFAEVREVGAGELLSSGALFIYNEAYADDTVMITWVSTGKSLSENGKLCYITFYLKESGEIAPALTDLGVCDQHLRPLITVPDSSANVNDEESASGGMIIYASSAVEGVDYSVPVFDNEPSTGDNSNADGKNSTPGKPSDGTGKASPVWLYISIAVALVAAFGVLCYITRRRRRATKPNQKEKTDVES